MEYDHWSQASRVYLANCVIPPKKISAVCPHWAHMTPVVMVRKMAPTFRSQKNRSASQRSIQFGAINSSMSRICTFGIGQHSFRDQVKLKSGLLGGMLNNS